MQKTTEYQNAVTAIVSRASGINPKIGSYMEHFINESFNFTVRLDNGRVSISRELAQDYQATGGRIEQERIIHVANSYQER